MLFKGVDVFATGFLSDEAVVIDGVDVLFPRNCITEASAGAVFEADAPSLVPQRLLDVCSCIDIIVKPADGAAIASSFCTRRAGTGATAERSANHIPFGDLHFARWVAILNDDHMVLFEEWAPHLQELQVSDGGNNYVQIVAQIRQRASRVSHDFKLSRDKKLSIALTLA